MVKSKKTKQKQKQSQSQTVVVNIGTTKSRKKSSGQQPQQQQQQQRPTIQQQAVIPPYLGLQTANNAQLLNTLQTSLTQLYNQQNRQKQLYNAPPLPASQGYTSTTLEPPPTPQANPVLQTPIVNLPPETPAISATTQETAPKSKSKSSSLFSVRFSNRETPAPIGDKPLPPPQQLVKLAEKDKKVIPGLKYTDKGLIDRRSSGYRRLSQEEKDELDYEEARNKPPVRAKAMTMNDDEAVLDAPAIIPKKTKKSGSNAATQLVMEDVDEGDDFLFNPKTKVISALSNHKLHGHTDMKPKSAYQQQSIFSFANQNKVFPEASTEETDTEYGKVVGQGLDAIPV